MTMKVLELFAWSRSMGKVADELGFEVFSVDVKPFDNINLVQDIEFLDPEQIPFKPDMIWASPPCTTYSIAGISHHRDNWKPKTDFAAKSDRLVLNTLKLIEYYGCDYYIENPRGYLRKMDFMQDLPRATIWYCAYWDMRAKPTDIWSNNIYSPLFDQLWWIPRPECWNWNTNCQHEAAPRGSSTWTQWLKNNYERSKLPQKLCEDVLIQTNKKHET